MTSSYIMSWFTTPSEPAPRYATCRKLIISVFWFWILFTSHSTSGPVNRILLRLFNKLRNFEKKT
jgi:hypothetical protein